MNVQVAPWLVDLKMPPPSVPANRVSGEPGTFSRLSTVPPSGPAARQVRLKVPPLELLALEDNPPEDTPPLVDPPELSRDEDPTSPELLEAASDEEEPPPRDDEPNEDGSPELLELDRSSEEDGCADEEPPTTPLLLPLVAAVSRSAVLASGNNSGHPPRTTSSVPTRGTGGRTMRKERNDVMGLFSKATVAPVAYHTRGALRARGPGCVCPGALSPYMLV